MPHQKDEPEIEYLRTYCLSKGVAGIKGLGALFRGLDKDFSKHLNYHEFSGGLKQFGVGFNEQQIQTLFRIFDKDQNGCVDFSEFLQKLRPPMAQSRINVTNEVFSHLDHTGDGRLMVDDLKGEFRKHVRRHPKFLAEEWTEEQVLVSFLNTFDTPEDIDGIVTRDEFLAYYSGVSSTIEEDCYFDLMMRSCWGLK
ncbi:calcyphosin-like protein [Lineus longissimus]|uniref:calcyphosin-like protein n=1 Tax=Lineus longissimus TaxID=88925 RepID=UPI002B4CCE81